MNPPRLGQPARFWIASALSAAIVFAALGLAIAAIRAVDSNNRVLETARRDLALLERRRSEYLSSRTALDHLAGERDLIRGAFPDPAAPLPFIETIEALGRRYGLRIELAFAQTAERMDGTAFLVTASGPFAGVMPFFGQLESLPFLAELRSAELHLAAGTSGKPGETPPVALTATIVMITP